MKLWRKLLETKVVPGQEAKIPKVEVVSKAQQQLTQFLDWDEGAPWWNQEEALEFSSISTPGKWGLY